MLNESEATREVTVTVNRNSHETPLFSWTFDVQPDGEWTAVKRIFTGEEMPTEETAETKLTAETRSGRTTTTTITGGIAMWREIARGSIFLGITENEIYFDLPHFGHSGYTPARCY